jgi:PadR family transcriptional regulator AphA
MKESGSKSEPLARGARRTTVRARLAEIRLGARELSHPIRTSLEHALLGLIFEMPGITGYDVVQIFDLSMAHFWHARQGQIYPTLDRMDRAGLIRSRAQVQKRRPNKRLYSIAARGERVLREWLESPVEEFRIKYPMLLCTRFLGHLGADRALQKLVEQKVQCGKYLGILRAAERTHFAGPKFEDVHEMFSYFTLRYGIEWMEESVRWCDWVAEEIERNRALFTRDDASAAKSPPRRGPVR